MAKEIEYVNLEDIAPPSLTGDKNVQDLFKAIDPHLKQVSEAVSEAFIISRINTLPEPVLDLLAWQWHVDFYEIARTIDMKRSMVVNSIAWHRKKGTRWAILKALEMLGVEAKFTSWQELQEEGAQPYTFVIDAKLTADFWERVDWTKPTQTIRRAILESKAARSWMSRIDIHMDVEGEQNIYIGGAIYQGIKHDIGLVYNPESEGDFHIVSAGAVVQGVSYSIGMIENDYSSATLEINSGGVISTGAEFNISMVA